MPEGEEDADGDRENHDEHHEQLGGAQLFGYHTCDIERIRHTERGNARDSS